MTELLAAELARLVRTWSRGSLVDVGCGRAPLLGTYVSLVDRCTLIDWPSSFHGRSTVDVYVDLADDLPFPTGTFDTLLFSDVLEHLPDGRHVVGELARVASDDAILIGSVPFLYGLHEEPHDHHRYTRFALDELLTGAGFVVVVLREYGGSMDVVVDLLSKHLATLGRVGRVVAVALQRVWLGVRRVPVLTEKRSLLRAKYPLGYVFVARRPSARRGVSTAPGRKA